jgi:hypothetical protein
MTIKFKKNFHPKFQKINEEYVIDKFTPYTDGYNDDELQDYVGNFTEQYIQQERLYNQDKKLKTNNNLTLTDYGINSSIYFGTDLNNINEINQKLKEINEEVEIYNGEPCISMIKYTRICDSAIMPCKSIINSIRENDSAIMPCKYIINLIRENDSAIMPCKSIINSIRKNDLQNGPPVINTPSPTEAIKEFISTAPSVASATQAAASATQVVASATTQAAASAASMAADTSKAIKEWIPTTNPFTNI